MYVCLKRVDGDLPSPGGSGIDRQARVGGKTSDEWSFSRTVVEKREKMFARSPGRHEVDKGCGLVGGWWGMEKERRLKTKTKKNGGVR